ncbi:SBBP repeat-containing protein [Vicingaceae bacterium]|nr:SBBP repeat-containing protein [Vicingaceae bacterium]
MGGSRFDFGQSIAVDSAGNLYTTGYFFNTVDFDPGTGINFTYERDFATCIYF